MSILAPLLAGGQTVGVLLGPSLGDVTRFGEEERQLVDTTARALSAAFENGSLERSLQQMKTIEQELKHLALHDPLTHLPNRTRFVERVSAVATDDFKFVNDSLGHDIGDELLVNVGRQITGCLRPDDLAAAGRRRVRARPSRPRLASRSSKPSMSRSGSVATPSVRRPASVSPWARRARK